MTWPTWVRLQQSASRRAGVNFDDDNALNGDFECITDVEALKFRPRAFVLTDPVMRSHPPPDIRSVVARLNDVYYSALVEADSKYRLMHAWLQVDLTMMERRTDVTSFHDRRTKAMLILIEKTLCTLQLAAKHGSVPLAVLHSLEMRVLLGVFPTLEALLEVFDGGKIQWPLSSKVPLRMSDGTMTSYLEKEHQMRKLLPRPPVPLNALERVERTPLQAPSLRFGLVSISPSDSKWARVHASLNALQTPFSYLSPSPPESRTRFQITELCEVVNDSLRERYMLHASWLRAKNAVEGVYERVRCMRYNMIKTSGGVSAITENMEAGGANEFLLYHGTSPAAANSIIIEGFDLRMATAGRLGRGLYFGSSATKANQYASRDAAPGVDRVMLVCRVLMGLPYDAPVNMSSDLSRPPRGEENEQLFDSVVYMRNKMFSEFAVYDARAVFPLYYVLYREVEHGTTAR